ncbi:MAG: endolytic transglycosylase MltG, partial [Clostridia bacterium]
EGVTDYYFVQDALKTGRVSERKYLLEGYLAPNTYEVYTNATPLQLIKKLLDQTDYVFTSEWQDRAAELNMTMDQALTLASLIEKEAKKPDFAKVSAVFHNRVKDGMKLQSDVTIHYITGERRMSLRNSDLAVESPYNTYKYAGLPLGPICNPSPEAINAALYPDESYVAEKYLYFCSKDPDTGELYFSKTLDEHNRAVAIYAPLWQAYDKERGM